MRNLLEAARCVEAGRQFVGERLVVDETVCASRADGLLVELLGIERAAIDAGNLGTDQRGAVLEVRRAVLGPFLELAMVSCQSVLVLSTMRGGCRIAERSPRQRGVELVVCQLEGFRRRPKKSSRVFCRFDGGNVRTREEAGLQLADEVPAGDESQPRILRQMLLEPALVELGIVERVELRGQAAEGPDESQLSGDDVGDVAEPELARELEAGLGFAQHFTEGLPGGEQVRDRHVTAVTRVGEISVSGGRLEGAPHQAAASANGLRPGKQAAPEDQADAALEQTQAAMLHKVQAELSEAEAGRVVAETMAEEHAETDVGEARSVAVPMFQAEVCHPADDEAEEILVGPQGRRQDCVEDVHGAAQFGFRHQRQIDELLDRATPDLAPDTLVFLLDLLLRRLRGPLDTRLPQIVEACLDSAAAPAERCEQLFLQPRDGG